MSEWNELEEKLANGIALYVDWIRRHAARALLIYLVATLPMGYWAATHLSTNANLEDMFDQELPQRVLRKEMFAIFPFLRDNLIVVVDGPSQTGVREIARELVDEMQARPDLFTDVFLPEGDPYFRRNGLLYLTPDELDEMGDQLAKIQPVIAEISSDPSLRGLFNLLQLSLEEGETMGVEGEDLDGTMGELADTIDASLTGSPVPFPWDEALAGKSLDKLDRRQVIVTQTVADYSLAQPMADSINFIRGKSLEIQKDNPEFSARLTGEMALVHDDVDAIHTRAWEFAVLSLVLVSTVLFFALRSWRLNLIVITTLLLGLIQTAGFAAFFIGSLNIISSTFPVLIIGLAVDFGLHFCMGYQDQITLKVPHKEALHHVANRIGSSLVMCAFTTSIAFLSFQVTDFKGVSELGLICGVGMILSLIGGLTVIPALLTLWPGELAPRPAKPLNGLLVWFSGFPARARRPITMAAIALVVLGFLVLPFVGFNSNPVDVRDPTTESASLFAELLEDRSEVLLSMFFLLEDEDEAREMVTVLEELDVVKNAMWIESFVPEEQEEKLEILQDISEFLPEPRLKEPPSFSQDVEAIQDFAAFLNGRGGDIMDPEEGERQGEEALRRGLNQLTGALEHNEAPGAILETLRGNLIAPLAMGISDLRGLLDAQQVSLDDLPTSLVNRFVGIDGELRMVVTPAYSLDTDQARKDFCYDVQALVPKVMGIGPETLESAALIARSLRDALIAAVIAMILFLAVLWRRPVDIACVFFPLILGTVLTCVGMVIIGMTFNFANVIGIPLMLGIGIDTGIHLVHRSRVEGAHGEALLRTGTTRAVIYSNLTTMASFGSLGVSTHLGMASLGKTLFIAILFILFANLVVLPALLEGGLRRENPQT